MLILKSISLINSIIVHENGLNLIWSMSVWEASLPWFCECRCETLASQAAISSPGSLENLLDTPSTTCTTVIPTVLASSPSTCSESRIMSATVACRGQALQCEEMATSCSLLLQLESFTKFLSTDSHSHSHRELLFRTSQQCTLGTN